MISEPGGKRRCGYVEVSVNRQRVTLRAGSIAGLELKQEAAAQGAELQLGFQLWIKQGDRYTVVYDEDLVDVGEDQEYLAVSADDHARSLPGRSTKQALDETGARRNRRSTTRRIRPPAGGAWSFRRGCGPICLVTC